MNAISSMPLHCEVAITGRLASMTREQAIGRLRASGARYVSQPTEATRYVVVGGDGWPLMEDGRLTRALAAAERLQRAGASLEVVAEEQLIEMLDAATGSGPREPATQLYTIGQLSRMLDTSERELRSWIRAGLLEPTRVERRLAFFEFRQVVAARSLAELLRGGARVAEIRRSLSLLKEWFPDAEGSLARLQALEQDGSQLLVRLSSGELAEPSGQLRLGFVTEVVEEPDEVRGVMLPSIARRTQQEWFAEGVRAAEAGELETAVDAYHEALLAGGPRAEICFNFGNVLHSLGQRGEAAQRFMQAVEIDPEYVEAWNNLGNTLAELDRGLRAIVAYERALELEPTYADAHFNLAATLEGMDRAGDARLHWEAYLRQDPNSPEADYVRGQLARSHPPQPAGPG